MQRRAFVQLTAWTATVLALPFINGCATKTIDIEAQPLFFSHLVDAETILEAGRAYRKANHREDDKNKLKELLLANVALSQSADDKAISDALKNKVINDFKAGNTRVVNGWVLSLTEARQSALFSILKS